MFTEVKKGSESRLLDLLKPILEALRVISEQCVKLEETLATKGTHTINETDKANALNTITNLKKAEQLIETIYTTLPNVTLFNAVDFKSQISTIFVDLEKALKDNVGISGRYSALAAQYYENFIKKYSTNLLACIKNILDRYGSWLVFPSNIKEQLQTLISLIQTKQRDQYLQALSSDIQKHLSPPSITPTTAISKTLADLPPDIAEKIRRLSQLKKEAEDYVAKYNQFVKEQNAFEKIGAIKEPTVEVIKNHAEFHNCSEKFKSNIHSLGKINFWTRIFNFFNFFWNTAATISFKECITEEHAQQDKMSIWINGYDSNLALKRQAIDELTNTITTAEPGIKIDEVLAEQQQLEEKTIPIITLIERARLRAEKDLLFSLKRDAFKKQAQLSSDKRSVSECQTPEAVDTLMVTIKKTLNIQRRFSFFMTNGAKELEKLTKLWEAKKTTAVIPPR